MYTFFGDDMKELLKKAMMPIFLSIFLGSICGKLVYKIYLGNNEFGLRENIIYLIQSGAYSSYDNMRANTIGYNYIYYEENDLYKTIIGVTKDKNNIEKIKKTYGKEVIVNEYYTEDKKLNDEIDRLDVYLSNEEDVEKIQKIIIDMLNLYNSDNNMKLTKVS